MKKLKIATVEHLCLVILASPWQSIGINIHSNPRKFFKFCVKGALLNLLSFGNLCKISKLDKKMMLSREQRRAFSRKLLKVAT